MIYNNKAILENEIEEVSKVNRKLNTKIEGLLHEEIEMKRELKRIENRVRALKLDYNLSLNYYFHLLDQQKALNNEIHSNQNTRLPSS